jgi:hypothetical protein
MRANTINAQDIWNASNLKESKKLLAALNKEIKKIKAWHGWAQSAEDLKAQIANGEEGLGDLLIEAETNRDDWEAENKDGIIRY